MSHITLPDGFVTDEMIEYIAQHAHEANRAYCGACRENDHLPWELTPEGRRKRVRSGVRAVLSGSGPGGCHEQWLREQRPPHWG